MGGWGGVGRGAGGAVGWVGARAEVLRDRVVVRRRLKRCRPNVRRRSKTPRRTVAVLGRQRRAGPEKREADVGWGRRWHGRCNRSLHMGRHVRVDQCKAQACNARPECRGKGGETWSDRMRSTAEAKSGCSRTSLTAASAVVDHSSPRPGAGSVAATPGARLHLRSGWATSIAPFTAARSASASAQPTDRQRQRATTLHNSKGSVRAYQGWPPPRQTRGRRAGRAGPRWRSGAHASGTTTGRGGPPACTGRLPQRAVCHIMDARHAST